MCTIVCAELENVATTFCRGCQFKATMASSNRTAWAENVWRQYDLLDWEFEKQHTHTHAQKEVISQNIMWLHKLKIENIYPWKSTVIQVQSLLNPACVLGELICRISGQKPSWLIVMSNDGHTWSIAYIIDMFDANFMSCEEIGSGQFQQSDALCCYHRDWIDQTIVSPVERELQSRCKL